MNTEFLNALASANPTPGGGGACAACASMACALAEMVGNLTVGKKKYASVEADVQKRLRSLAKLREKLVGLIEADACAFKPLAAAYRMPKETRQQRNAKNEAMQTALVGAIDVPLEIMQTSFELLSHISFLAHSGSLMAISDAGVAASFAKAAVESASLNVFINTSSLEDKTLASKYEQTAHECVARTNATASEIFSFVQLKILN